MVPPPTPVIHFGIYKCNPTAPRKKRKKKKSTMKQRFFTESKFPWLQLICLPNGGSRLFPPRGRRMLSDPQPRCQEDPEGRPEWWRRPACGIHRRSRSKKNDLRRGVYAPLLQAARAAQSRPSTAAQPDRPSPAQRMEDGGTSDST